MLWAEACAPPTVPAYSRDVAHEPVLTVPNGVTVLRTVLSIALAMAALAMASTRLLTAAYLVYWVGDMADGALARRLGQETRIGAVFDIVADRANSLLCVACFVALDPPVALPMAVYVVEFAVVDTMLSLSFLPFEIKSPNDFHTVDLTLWLWNWSRPAKALNTSSVVLACLTGHILIATVLACSVLAAKTVSCAHLRNLIPPNDRS